MSVSNAEEAAERVRAYLKGRLDERTQLRWGVWCPRCGLIVEVAR